MRPSLFSSQQVAVIVSSLIFSACGPRSGWGRLELQVGVPGAGRTAATSSGDALSACSAELHARARSGDAEFLGEFDGTGLDWTAYFGTTGTLLSGGTAALSVTANTSFALDAWGAVFLKAADATASLTVDDERYLNLGNLGEATGSSGIFSGAAVSSSLWTESDWECGDAALWTELNLLEPLVTHEASTVYGLGSVPQFVVPVTGSASDLVSVQPGASAAAEMSVTVARVPLGAYSLYSLMNAGFAAETASEPDPGLFAPFGLVKLKDLTSRLDLTNATTSYVDVIPVVKDLDTGVVWRGGSAGKLVDFIGDETFPVYVYPLPPSHRLRLGLFLKCASQGAGYSNCAQLGFLSQDTGVTESSTALWMDSDSVCLWSDVSLPELTEGESSYPFPVSLDSDSVTIGSNNWGTTSVTSGALAGTPVTDIAPDGCAASFYAD